MIGTAQQQLTQFAARRSAVCNATESVGISLERMSEDVKAVCAAAGGLAASITSRAVGQAIYDHTTNIPTGILSASLPVPPHALHSGIVAALGEFVAWDINAALKLCRDLLEDVNAHPESAQVQAMIDRLP